MAEIKIEKKKTIWPWIIAGLVVLAIILYFLFFRKDNDDNVTDAAATTTPVTDSTNTANPNDNNNTVDAFVTYVNTDTATMGIDHVFTHNALIKLIDATKATADKQSFDVQAELDKAKEDADKITDDATATTHADYIKDATSKLSTAMQNMQQAKYPQLNAESQKVKDASKDISTADLTLDQKHTVKTFFDDAADLLKKMN